MSSAAQGHHALRLLALDGGGIRGLSELLILHEIMKIIQSKTKLNDLPLPCDYFDLIGGTSTGGLIAIMLGRFRMTTQQAIEQYRNLAQKVFSEKKRYKAEVFRATNLTEAIKDVMKEYGDSPDGESVMLDNRPNACFTFVCAQSAESVGSPTLFRTYPVPRDGGDREYCKIWEAARATSAAPTFFKPIEIGTRQKFIDGGLGCNNPVKAVLKEAGSLFNNDRPVGCILSLGTGTPEVNSLGETNFIQSFVPTKVINVLKKVATDCEMVAEELEGRYKHTPGIYIRLNVDQGMQAVTLAEWEKDGMITTHTQKYLARTRPSELVDMAVAALMGESANTLALGQLLGNTSLELRNSNVHNTVPHSASPIFTGREDVLGKLRDYFFATDPSNQKRVFVLYGLGGSGKTQISLEFIRRYSDRFWGVFWVDASTPDMVERSFCDIALELGVEASSVAAKTFLENCKNEYQWLLIIDNADDPGIDLETIFPRRNKGKILVTTRNPECKWHSPNGYFEVDAMEPDDAIKLLLRTAGVDNLPNEDSQKQLAAKVVQELGYLALAITHAGRFVANGSTMRRYLELLQDDPKGLFDIHFIQGSTIYHRTVFTIWELSFRAIKDPSASEILQLFAFFHYDGIPEEIFKYASESPREAQKLSKPLYDLVLQRPDGTWDSLNFERSIRILLSFSLIKQDIYKERKIYSIHPLLHSWSRSRLQVDEQISFRRLASVLIGCSVESILDSNKYSLLQLMPHIESCKKALYGCDYELKKIGTEEFVQPPIFWLVYDAAGKSKQAEGLLLVKLETERRELGEEHPDTLGSMNNLASTYQNQGRWKEAEGLQVVVLEARKRVLGEEHPSTLVSMNNLALTYGDQGRWKEAEGLQVVVLEAIKRVLGEEHPSTLVSMNNLALAYQNQGRWKEAEGLEVVVLEARKRVLGEEHPSTLVSMSNLASTYQDQGRWKEAEGLQVVELEASKRVLGEEHPDTLVSMNNLASTYQNQGRWKEAEGLQVVELEASKRVLGEEHPDTLRSMSNLASTYQDQGRWKEAEGLQVVVLEARKRVLGEEHPHTLVSMKNLACTYQKQGRKKRHEFKKLSSQLRELRSKS